MDFWQYIVLFISVILGGGLALLVKKNDRVIMQWVLSFAGAYILGISVLHLMPMVFGVGSPNIGIWVLAGFFLQLFLERLSSGVEHGHIHSHHEPKFGFALQIMIGLCVHAFIEGLPLGNYEQVHNIAHGHDHSGTEHLLFGIIFHKAPAAFALVLLLVAGGFRLRTVMICLLIFALSSPLGAALTSQLALRDLLTTEIIITLMAIVVGSFLHIATTIIFEIDGTSHHSITWKKLIAILIGTGLALLTIH